MQVLTATYVISSPDVAQCPAADRPEYAFIGRSNVGKSSLINSICNSQKLAKTSSSPGKTQLINHFAIESISTIKSPRAKWYLVDLPGYGYAKISQSSRRRWEQMIENYLRKRENLVNVFVLIDSRHSPQKIDLEFLTKLALWKVPFTLAFTKSDKEKPGAVERNVKAFLDAMRETWQFLPQGFVTSATKNKGREEILAFIDKSNNPETEG
ncbi:ribosome biogenesis GTP-binding protein YihA/YsxC [Parasediminibacterium sp. JCM 36343]|uniref:ribosome biogenesis GTP-binding protein YihA/YsxC n=1 Tax=Parasediminibacterium sp. JCM 36343 TaxID=3374279 RepID=UPI00397DEE39